MNAKKLYIMSMAASGKSTFATQNEYFDGYRIVDFAQHLPAQSKFIKLVLYLSRLVPSLRTLLANNPKVKARNSDNYFKNVFSFMENHETPVVVLGRLTPNNLKELEAYKTIRFSIVLIPEADHERNCRSRKQEMRNPFPLFHHWTTDFRKIEKIRARMSAYATRHDIALYDNFSDAIREMSQEPDSTDA